MSHINVTINGRQYRMACEEGQEVRLLKLAESLESRIQNLRGKFGEIGDARLTVMAALTACDELVDAGNRIRTMEQELNELRDFRNAAVERARMTQTAVVNALNAAAERIEKSTQVLNRTVGNGIAVGGSEGGDDGVMRLICPTCQLLFRTRRPRCMGLFCRF
jgi:cell division protein ZapA